MTITRPQRSARPGCLKELSFSEEDMDVNPGTPDNDNLIEVIDDVNEVEILHSKRDIDDPNAIPIMTQNSKEFELNHFKQYKKRIECCNREVV